MSSTGLFILLIFMPIPSFPKTLTLNNWLVKS